ncbi:MAG: chitinase, partial [Gammaproteobacteria bacterium]
VNENTQVGFDALLSSDPDSDPLSYSWMQLSGPAVIISDAGSAVPSFTTPFVNLGGADLTFQLTVMDGYGGSANDTLVVHVQNANDPPLITAAVPSQGLLWPPNHKLVPISILGVSDQENNTTITIDFVTQDEPTEGQGDGDTAVDAFIQADGTVLLRAERNGGGTGRVYHIHFTASDYEGSASGVVTVTVPKKKKQAAQDEGELYSSAN